MRLGIWTIVLAACSAPCAAQAVPDWDRIEILPAGALKSPVPTDAELAAAGSAAPVFDPIPPLPREVTVSLSPDLDDSLAAVRRVIEGTGVKIVAESGEYELTTPPDFPQTLLLEYRTQRPADYAPQPDPIGTFIGPRRLEMGNLLLDDYAAALTAELTNIVSARPLRNLPAGSTRALTCITAGPDLPRAPVCDLGGAMRAPQVDMSPISADLKPGLPVAISVRNLTPAPAYLAALIIDPDNRVVPVAIGDGVIPAGGWGQSPGLIFGRHGWHTLVTIVSDRPIDAAKIADQVRRGETSGDGWTATASLILVRSHPVVAVGNADPAPEDSAPWMAEMYSTVPYTDAEVAADKVRPIGQREFLDIRSPAERAHRCGGTLIAPDLVVTAAHCVAKGSFAGAAAVNTLKARRIRLHTYTLGRGGATYAIDAIAVHAGYRSGAQADDIALLRLRSDRASVAFDNVRFAALAGERGVPATIGRVPVSAFGWGFTGVVKPGTSIMMDQSGAVQRNPEQLQVGKLETQTAAVCRKRVGDKLLDGMLCAVPRQGGRQVFSCVGDSGGPLIRSFGNRDVLVGIASWSMGCGYANYPSVYTDVARYTRWVDAARTRLQSGRAVVIGQDGAEAAPAPR